MKSWLAALAPCIVLALQSVAQSNQPPVRLALISESKESSGAADILTAALSRNEKLHLLERNEIERVYHEQGLSAANKDFLKLGQLLGADGLFLLEVVKTAYETNLTTRLIAVKPGVVLANGIVSWPLEDTLQWADSVGHYLNSLVPKLSVLAKDAIPISVLNLRSAVQSAESTELERQLTSLMIRRLGQERELFVLERQRMERLSTEKELKGMDPTAFWNGSYLLDGVLDRDGYSREQITLNARLAPPAGGMPIEIAVAGRRNDLAKVVEQLAAKILESLRRTTTVPEWKPDEEAAKFVDEARWALKWGINKEAQSASESAWALGKQDRDCALVRVKSYMADVRPEARVVKQGSLGVYVANNSGKKANWDREIDRLSRSHAAVAFEEKGDQIHYFAMSKAPDLEDIKCASRALELYLEFSRTLPEDEPKSGSEWYRFGIEDLTAASKVLRFCYFLPKSHEPVAQQLAELRALARSVVSWLSKSPSVRDSYWVGDRITTHDELAHTIREEKNLFRCEAKYGSIWQERPEDCIALYRKLMSSPVFCYIHDEVWLRETLLPRVVAWNPKEKESIPDLWNRFLGELKTSTNYLLRLEASAFELADAINDSEKETAYDALFSGIFAHAEAMVSHNVDLLYLSWRVGELIARGGAVTPTREKLERKYYADHYPRFRALESEYWRQIDAKRNSQRNQVHFSSQKAYLTNYTPYESREFSKTFSTRQYTKDQAVELHPLLSAYASNLTVQAVGKPLREQQQLKSAIFFIGSVEQAVNRILNSTSAPPARVDMSAMLNTIPARAETARTTNRSPSAVARQSAPPGNANPPFDESVTNVCVVKHYQAIPTGRLEARNISDPGIFAHRWSDGRLLLGLRYQGTFEQYSYVSLAAVAVFNPENGTWEITKYPKDEIESAPMRLRTGDEIGPCFELLKGELYLSDGGRIKKYDRTARQWSVMNIPQQKDSRLFGVNGRLFAANDEAIFEILDEGKVTRLLASTRRRPAISILDSLETLGSVVLLPGPDSSLRAAVHGSVYSWNGSDWKKVLSIGQTKPPEVFDGATILRRAPFRQPAEIWLLPHNESNAELCWREEPKRDSFSGLVGGPPNRSPTTNQFSPTWKTSYRSPLAEAAVATENADLYFFAAFADLMDPVGQKAALERYGRHADLVCLQRDSERPLRIPLRFDSTTGSLPTNTSQPRPLRMNQIPWWILFAKDSLVIGHANAPGFWTIPRSELDDATAREKQLQRQKDLQLSAAVEQRKLILLAKHDRNKSGAFDPEEIENALADPDFIEFALDTIDATQDNLLQAAELGYFDANKNRKLDANEEAGIDAAQRLLAARMFKKLDDDQDQQLTRQEFALIALSSTPGIFPGGQTFSIADKNSDALIIPSELEAYLKDQTRQEVAAKIRFPSFRSPQTVIPPHLRPQLNFKESVEFYWNGPETPRAGP